MLAVLGPTGAGKSGLGIHLARRFNAEIVSCDSIQVYRGLNIGSAKLPVEARQGIPHHLIDIADPGDEVTAGAYARLGRGALQEISGRGRLPIIVGGTGFYFRALVEGLPAAPPRSEPLRDRLRSIAASRPAALYRFLRRYDPVAAARIHANDHQKLIRAIEITLTAGEPAVEVQGHPRQDLPGYSLLKLGLAPERASLRQQIALRTTSMFEGGLVREVEGLLSSGYSPEAKSLQSIGYKQAQDFLFGRSLIREAMEECRLKTCQYAKRQMTWFRADPALVWLPGFGTDESVQEQAVSLVERHILSASETVPCESEQASTAI